MFTHKLNVLVPNPKCTINGEQIIEWTDIRPQPTLVEINAVTEQQVSDFLLNQAAVDAVDTTKFNRLSFEINFDQENRLRALQALSPVTRAQHRSALIALYKTL